MNALRTIFIVASMATRKAQGSRLTTPSEYRAALAMRIKSARERARITQTQMAELLSAAVGRTISGATYRNWESIDSTIPVDCILPFCDLTHTHVYELLGRPAYIAASGGAPPGKFAA